eukprot:501099-Rhodomonas_salina.4
MHWQSLTNTGACAHSNSLLSLPFSPNDHSRKKASTLLGELDVNVIQAPSSPEIIPPDLLPSPVAPLPSPGAPPQGFVAAHGQQVAVGTYVLCNFDAGLYRGTVRVKRETRHGITVSVQFEDDQWETFTLPDSDLALWHAGDPTSPATKPAPIQAGKTARQHDRERVGRRADIACALANFKDCVTPGLRFQELADAEPTKILVWDEFKGVLVDSDDDEESRTALTAPGGGGLRSVMYPVPIQDGDVRAFMKFTEGFLNALPVTRPMIKSREELEAKALERVSMGEAEHGADGWRDADRERDDGTAECMRTTTTADPDAPQVRCHSLGSRHWRVSDPPRVVQVRHTKRAVCSRYFCTQAAGSDSEQSVISGGGDDELEGICWCNQDECVCHPELGEDGAACTEGNATAGDDVRVCEGMAAGA